MQAWCIPGVAVYSITNGFTKFVSCACVALASVLASLTRSRADALFLWLPFFLHSLGSTEANSDLFATVFDIGGVIGGIGIGAPRIARADDRPMTRRRRRRR